MNHVTLLGLYPDIAIIPVLTKATSFPCSVSGLKHYLIDYPSSDLGLRKDGFTDLSLTKNRHMIGVLAFKLPYVLEQAPI